jgi:hypothetical protein
MLKASDHLDKVKRVKVSEKDVASFLLYYQVRVFVMSCSVHLIIIHFQVALDHLKEAYMR